MRRAIPKAEGTAEREAGTQVVGRVGQKGRAGRGGEEAREAGRRTRRLPRRPVQRHVRIWGDEDWFGAWFGLV